MTLLDHNNSFLLYSKGTNKYSNLNKTSSNKTDYNNNYINKSLWLKHLKFIILKLYAYLYSSLLLAIFMEKI